MKEDARYRKTSFNFYFLLSALLIFVVGCGKAPKVVEQPKPVEQPQQVAPKPVETQPVEQPAQPQLPVKRGALNITSEPMGAKVYLDDKEMETTPMSLKNVPAGSYRVKMELEHYEAWRGDVDVKHQQMATVSAKLEPKPSALGVKSEPSGAKVQIDGKDVGERIDGAKMILIPAGEFVMGSPEGEGDDNEHPQHTVFLDAFYIDAYEVTNAQFKKFLEANPQWQKDKIERKYHDGNYLKDWDHTNYPSGKADHPVIYVSWYAAAAYAQWVGARLPTEAQWEKAARGGLVGKQYPWGDEISHDNANYNGTGGRDRWRGTAPVGSFPANGYGLYDMAGNVWEWCADEYASAYYKSSPKNNPTGPGTVVTFENDSFTHVKHSRVLRGGSWYYNPRFLRCAYRYGYGPAHSFSNVGFRCVVVPAED